MLKSSPKTLPSVWLPSAGLALLLLGASTPRLTAQQSWNFDGQNDTPFTRYQIPASAGYGAPTYSFPTNPASALNYGYRINQPAIASDPGSYFNARAGAMWTNGAGTLYGVQDDNLGRYSAGADLTAWNPTYVNQVVGVASLVQFNSFTSGSLVVGGWASGAFALAVAEISGFPVFELWGTSAFGETVLNPTHQYRLVFGSWNAANPDGYGTAFHLLQLFDKGNTNTAWQSAMGVDVNGTTWMHPGYCGIMVANVDAPPPIPPPFGGNTTEGADATFDNYYAYQPVFGLTPATMPAVVCDTYPPPCGSAPQFNPTKAAVSNKGSNSRLAVRFDDIIPVAMKRVAF